MTQLAKIVHAVINKTIDKLNKNLRLIASEFISIDDVVYNQR